VVNQQQTKWEAALPKETSDVLSAGRSGRTGTLDTLQDVATGFINKRLGTRKDESCCCWSGVWQP